LPTPINYLNFSIVSPVVFKLHGWTHEPASARLIKKFQQKNIMYLFLLIDLSLNFNFMLYKLYYFLCINKIQIQEFRIRIEILKSIELQPIVISLLCQFSVGLHSCQDKHIAVDFCIGGDHVTKKNLQVECISFVMGMGAISTIKWVAEKDELNLTVDMMFKKKWRRGRRISTCLWQFDM
jgi:hypothetical protein